MMNTRIFQVSSDLFWGYRVNLDITSFDSITSIIEYVRSDLKQFLLSKNLQMLVEKLDACHFHIHSPYNEYIQLVKQADDQTIIYICDHC